jgi:hypothetical protein
MDIYSLGLIYWDWEGVRNFWLLLVWIYAYRKVCVIHCYLQKRHLFPMQQRNFFYTVLFGPILGICVFHSPPYGKTSTDLVFKAHFWPVYPACLSRRSQLTGPGLYRLTCPCITAVNVEVVITKPNSGQANSIVGRETINQNMFCFCSLDHAFSYDKKDQQMHRNISVLAH